MFGKSNSGARALIWLGFIIYPFLLGLTLTTLNHGRIYLFNLQAFEIYGLIVSIYETVRKRLRNPIIKFGSPFSDFLLFFSTASRTMFFLVLAVLFGFFVSWAHTVLST